MIIAIHGFKQSGKDTVGARLVSHHGFKRVAFADRVKEVLALVFDIPLEKLFGSDEDKNTLSPVRWQDFAHLKTPAGKKPQDFLSLRELMQSFATEVCKEAMPSIWFQYLNFDKDEKIVVTDLRFNDEARWLKSKGAQILQIHRTGRQAESHASESGIDVKWVDKNINNDGSLQDLYDQVDLWISSLLL